MKNLYRRKGTVHPSPPLISDHLAFLPATILTLAAALSPEDREVLAYLISCSSTGSFSCHQKTNTHKKLLATSTSSGDHPPSFTCNCFRCYTSYWVRWDSSPSRQTIHEIIDAFEEEQLGGQSKREKSRRERRKRGSKRSGELIKGTESVVGLNYKDELGESESVEENIISACGGEDCGEGEGEEEVEKGYSICTYNCYAVAVHFWAPTFKWGISIANLADSSKPPEKVSYPQQVAVTATGLIWSRYSMVINPKNWNLFSVNVVMAATGIYQLSRKIQHDYYSEGEAVVAKE
ncbi:hypothetical protein RHGRI_004356 [Rhododendron griersonianum]|uniref:Mitochondrial pyruvate carrier n=1 Tax=Rhododendron griersonianum TaxID=479676 RepID=A0AAV6L8C6_9ERIC|nr:hypothetical protein RHGRI_004356 [Rhododendron griersonianum]